MQKIWLVRGGKAIVYHPPYFLYTRRWATFEEKLKNHVQI